MKTLLWLWVCLAVWGGGLRAEPGMVVTADVEGRLGPCPQCPGTEGFPGLARIGAGIARLRAEEPGLLVLDAGNGLTGGESVVDEGRTAARVFGAVGMDAMNMTHRDFRYGAGRLLELTAEGQLPAVSANLREAGGGRLFAPFVEVRGTVVIGLTERPAGMAFLPHLRKQLAGVEIAEPGAALAEVIPELPEAGPLVLLFYGDGAEGMRLAEQLRAAVPGRAVRLAVSGEGVAEGEGVVSADRSGKTLRGSGGRVFNLKDIPADAGLKEVMESSLREAGAGVGFLSSGVSRAGVIDLRSGTVVEGGGEPAGGGFVLEAGEGPVSAETLPAVAEVGGENLPADFEVEVLGPGVAVGVSGQNGSVRVSVERAHVFERVGGEALEGGEVLLGLWVRVERLASVAEAVAVRNLEEMLWAVGNLGTQHRMEDIRGVPVAMASRFTLGEPGAAEVGLVFYRLRREGFRHFELHWLDGESGNVVLPVFPLGEGVLAAAEPLVAGANAVARLGVHGVEVRETFEERNPGRGEWCVVEVRGESLRRGAAGEQILNWRDWVMRSQLILDGGEVFPLEVWSAGLPEALPLLPGRSTGGMLAFDLPAGAFAAAESAELVLGFGPHVLPGGGVGVPETVRVMLKGSRVPVRVPEGEVTAVEDLDFRLTVHGVTEPERVANQYQEGGWLEVDVSVAVSRPEGVVFRPGEVLGLTRRGGRDPGIHHLVWGESGESARGTDAQWIPGGDVRRVRVYWRVAPAERAGWFLRVAGVWAYRLISLGLGEGEVFGAEPMLEDSGMSELGRRVWFPELEPKGIAGVELTPEQVNGAIDRGRAFLLEQLRPEYEGKPLRGRRYLIPALYALVNTDAHREDAAFDEALRGYLRGVRPTDFNIYEVGMLAMIVRAYGDPGFYGKLEELTRYMVEAQGENGTWHYTAYVPEELFPEAAEAGVAEAGAFAVSGGAAPVEVSGETGAGGMARGLSFTAGRDGDNSCTQFGVLGLWSAARAGIRVDGDVWRRTLRSAAAFQALDPEERFGGFGYGASGSVYGSMTAAVLCTAAIAMRQLDAEADVAGHPRIRNALDWLARHFSVSVNPVTKRYNYYFLYSLERVGQILGSEFIGEHEWYPLGARHLVDVQGADGSWPAGPGESEALLTTSYALLFLLRATPQMDEELVPEAEAEGPGRLVTGFVNPPAPPRVYLIFDASGSMRAPMEGRMKFEVAREAVGELVGALPDAVEFGLRVYGHRRNALHEEADRDSELVLPFARLDREAAGAVMARLRPVGRTPLAFSLEEALGDAGSGRETLVVLLTDGGDDTRGDPVAAAAGFAGREGVTLHVLGFDINRPNWTRQLTELAAAAGGRYQPVERAGDLARELRAMVAPPPPVFQLTAVADGRTAEGRFGETVEDLAPGEYVLRTEGEAGAQETRFWVHPGRTVTLTYDWGVAGR